MNELKKVNWIRITIFYTIILLLTFLVRKLPNILQIILKYFTDIHFPWNFNHGLALLIVTLFFYKFYSDKPSEITFLGTNKLKSILFPIILFIGYSIYGIENEQGINKHIWAFIFCLFTFIYDLMEEYTWRGYLIENLGKVHLAIKSSISGIFWAIWHLLIFSDFEQYGGFIIFLIFCVIFSFLLTFSIIKTKALIVPSAIHALLIRSNIITLICLILYLLILFTWDKTLKLNTSKN